LKTRTKAAAGLAAAITLAAFYLLGGFGAPKFHPFGIELPLRKNCMVRGMLQNIGGSRATNVEVTVKILVGSVDSVFVGRDKKVWTVHGTPRNVLFEFRAVVFEKLDATEANGWMLTWDDATAATRERHGNPNIEQFEIHGTVKVVVDLRCDEGVEEHWEFTFEL